MTHFVECKLKLTTTVTPGKCFVTVTCEFPTGQNLDNRFKVHNGCRNTPNSGVMFCISIQTSKDVIQKLRLVKMFVSGNDHVQLILITCC